MERHARGDGHAVSVDGAVGIPSGSIADPASRSSLGAVAEAVANGQRLEESGLSAVPGLAASAAGGPRS